MAGRPQMQRTETQLAMAMLGLAPVPASEPGGSEYGFYQQQQQGPSTCVCGSPLKVMDECKEQLKDLGGMNKCHICGITKQNIMYTCSRGEACPQTQHTVALWCQGCAAHISTFNTDPILEEHNVARLFFIYNKGQIKGPMTTKAIISLYVTNKIKGKKIYITDALNPETPWLKLRFPDGIAYKLKDEDEKRMHKIPQCMAENALIKQHFPDLYKALVENVMTKRIRRAVVPADVPKEAKKGKIALFILNFFGKIFTTAAAIIILVHVLPVFLIVPIGAIYSVLTYTNWFKEIQSWMIGYCTWGAFSFFFSGAIWYRLSITPNAASPLINTVLPSILGVDFGEWSLSEVSNDWAAALSIVFLFPSVASLLPASIVGFVANFILEEQFALKCSDEIDEKIVCFEGSEKCCDVISSHDFLSSYEFMGSFASNIIAMWAVIRILGYLMINASASLSLYVHRR
eukprot:CAMPEP_0201595618 /NCGR_PEP_ID=MMETSP0190_2-20130828/192565_1 /ASSEMBLY_ACC=CAM_ASM_000263 /TAXON_ID=37353 /ORGANISM="Rosalina sp." /LENGTH=458 /DNA_ID=CAMNT_0048055671 /DNA_START=28 /DNA_END=1404 /DNA_ORIENTATION=+